MWIFEKIDKGKHLYRLSPFTEIYLIPSIIVSHNFSTWDNEFLEPRVNFYLMWWSWFIKISFVRIDA